MLLQAFRDCELIWENGLMSLLTLGKVKLTVLCSQKCSLVQLRVLASKQRSSRKRCTHSHVHLHVVLAGWDYQYTCGCNINTKECVLVQPLIVRMFLREALKRAKQLYLVKYLQDNTYDNILKEEDQHPGSNVYSHTHQGSFDRTPMHLPLSNTNTARYDKNVTTPPAFEVPTVLKL